MRGAAYFKLGQALSTDIAVNQSMHSNKCERIILEMVEGVVIVFCNKW